MAARNGLTVVVQELLAKGASVLAVDENGKFTVVFFCLFVCFNYYYFCLTYGIWCASLGTAGLEADCKCFLCINFMEHKILLCCYFLRLHARLGLCPQQRCGRLPSPHPGHHDACVSLHPGTNPPIQCH